MSGRRRVAEGVRLIMLSRDEREKYGCIVTFSDDHARWFPGRDGLKDATAYADREGVKIRTVSTPQTIYRDMQGTRAKEASRGRLVAGVVVFPEQHMLGLLGRQNLLEIDTDEGR